MVASWILRGCPSHRCMSTLPSSGCSNSWLPLLVHSGRQTAERSSYSSSWIKHRAMQTAERSSYSSSWSEHRAMQWLECSSWSDFSSSCRKRRAKLFKQKTCSASWLMRVAEC